MLDGGDTRCQIGQGGGDLLLLAGHWLVRMFRLVLGAHGNYCTAIAGWSGTGGNELVVFAEEDDSKDTEDRWDADAGTCSG